MDEAKGKPKIAAAAQAVPAKTGEVSDAELEKMAGGEPGEEVTFEIEQAQTIGTSSAGVGAGKVTFQPI